MARRVNECDRCGEGTLLPTLSVYTDESLCVLCREDEEGLLSYSRVAERLRKEAHRDRRGTRGLYATERYALLVRRAEREVLAFDDYGERVVVTWEMPPYRLMAEGLMDVRAVVLEPREGRVLRVLDRALVEGHPRTRHLVVRGPRWALRGDSVEQIRKGMERWHAEAAAIFDHKTSRRKDDEQGTE